MILERRWSERGDGRSQRQHVQSGKSLSGNVRSISKCLFFSKEREVMMEKGREWGCCEGQNILMNNIMSRPITSRDRKLDSISVLPGVRGSHFEN